LPFNHILIKGELLSNVHALALKAEIPHAELLTLHGTHAELLTLHGTGHELHPDDWSVIIEAIQQHTAS
jgi:hypothetical protein